MQEEWEKRQNALRNQPRAFPVNVPAQKTSDSGLVLKQKASQEKRKRGYNKGELDGNLPMYFFLQSVNPRQSMRSRPRCRLQSLPAVARPNLFSGD
jgi:hypothetical protein